MLGENESNHIGTEPSRGEPADQDIGVEEDLHDTTLTMSSSVRNPLASANGMALCLSCSNVIKESCRRKASRTTSLRFRFERRQNFSSIRSRSWSRRIVTAFFMSHKVIQMQLQCKKVMFSVNKFSVRRQVVTAVLRYCMRPGLSPTARRFPPVLLRTSSRTVRPSRARLFGPLPKRRPSAHSPKSPGSTNCPASSARCRSRHCNPHDRRQCIARSEEHTSELQSPKDLVCRLL